MFQVLPVGLLKIVKNCQWVAVLPSNSVLLTQIIRKNALGLRSLLFQESSGPELADESVKLKEFAIESRLVAITRSILQFQKIQNLLSPARPFKRGNADSQLFHKTGRRQRAPPPLRAEQDATRRQTRRKIRADSRRLKIGLLRPSFSRSDNAVLAILLIWNENVIFPEKNESNDWATQRCSTEPNSLKYANHQLCKFPWSK